MRLSDAEWITGSITAGGALLVAQSPPPDLWTNRAYSALGACVVLVGGGLVLLGRIDKAWMDRRKAWDEFNSSSISEQLAKSNENQVKMRESLHAVRGMQQTTLNENTSLRDDLGVLRSQFMELAGTLRTTEKDLHSTNVALFRALGDVKDVHTRLKECESDRQSLHSQVDQLTVEVRNNQVRIQHVEESGEHRSLLPPEGSGGSGLPAP